MRTGRTILIMGPPGAGKGTQAAHLVSEYGLRHVATGDLLRNNVAAGTELGRAARKYMDAGELVPDEVIIGMLGDLVDELPADTGVLLDGFPRTVPQAEALDALLAGGSRSIDAVLDIAVPADELVSRLSGRWICRDCQTPYNVNTAPPKVEGVCDRCGGELYQRDDDKPEAVRNRLSVYERQTAPVSRYYADKGVLTTIDGNQPPSAVQAALATALSEPAGARQS